MAASSLVWVIVVDDREHDLRAEFTKLTLPPTVRFHVERLLIGDVWVLQTFDHVPVDAASLWKEATQLFVFERKTMADWKASLQDGRYKEQYERTMASLAELPITTSLWYLLETSSKSRCPFASHQSLFTPSYQGSVLSKLEKGHPILWSENCNTSAQWLHMFVKRRLKEVSKEVSSAPATVSEIQSAPFQSQSPHHQMPPGSSVETATLQRVDYIKTCSKKRAATGSLTHVLQLIKGISSGTAALVSGHFHDSLIECVQHIQTNPGGVEVTLSQLQGPKRKLGPALAKRIVEYFQQSVNE
jgi:ERCC4-type nuclease